MLMLATFILFVREGLEASLIVSILFAVLRQLRLTHQARAVWTGVGLAIIGSLVAGVVVYLTVHAYPNTLLQQVFETVPYLVAAVDAAPPHLPVGDPDSRAGEKTTQPTALPHVASSLSCFARLS